MTPDADITNVRFTKSVIASKAAFTYEEAQIRKDDPFVFVSGPPGFFKLIIHSSYIRLATAKMI
jgi:hypothetical protein